MGVQSTAGPDEGPPSLFSGEHSRPKSLVNRDALDAHLEPDEAVIYGLPGTGELVCDGMEGKETVEGNEIGLVVTDRRALLVARQEEGRQVIVVPYTQVESVGVSEGFFNTRLEITLQNGTEYRLEPAATDSLTRVRGYVSVASECVQTVDQALENAVAFGEQLAEHIRTGRGSEVEPARESLRAAVGRAETELDEAGIDPGRSDKIETVRQECAEMVLQARRDRAETLVSEALHQADATAYTGAYRTYLDAREHLERALALEIRYEFGLLEPVQAEIDEVDQRIESLELRPLALAKQARERAMHTETLEDAVQAWERTYEHYRDLLTAGWGTDLEFAGTKSDIRFQLECAVDNLIDCRRSLARTRETEGDHHRDADEPAQAQDCYEAALDQVRAAYRAAKQYRAGDAAAIREQGRQIKHKTTPDPDV